MRQYVVEDDDEVGHVTWYLAAPEFFARRRKLEECWKAQGVTKRPRPQG